MFTSSHSYISRIDSGILPHILLANVSLNRRQYSMHTSHKVLAGYRSPFGSHIFDTSCSKTNIANQKFSVSPFICVMLVSKFCTLLQSNAKEQP
jgi:hypothetical protein